MKLRIQPQAQPQPAILRLANAPTPALNTACLDGMSLTRKLASPIRMPSLPEEPRVDASRGVPMDQGPVASVWKLFSRLSINLPRTYHRCFSLNPT